MRRVLPIVLMPAASAALPRLVSATPMAQTGTYLLQLSNFRPADVQFHLDVRRG